MILTKRTIEAVLKACLSKPELMTGDSIGALTKGHGMLNIAGFCSANVIAEEILKGRSIKVKALDKPEIDVEFIIEKGVKAAMEAGADASNAALITAALCYIAGSNVRDGIPSGNRKLGAIARLKAGAQKGGVAIIPTPKSNNKISGFAAVHAIYHAIMEGKLSRVDGKYLPQGVAGGPLCGHSTLGEDFIFPEIAQNAAKVGTKAMLDAYAGAGMRPNLFISSILGAAAALEIVHPDAAVAEEYGPLFKVHSPDLVGKAATETAGLPKTLHFKVTNEEFETSKIVGDLGLILKDIGTPTVIGMIAFNEIFGCFRESGLIGAGGSGGPKTLPLGHQLADASIALRIISTTKSIDNAAEAVRRNKGEFIDPETAFVAANTLVRKAEELRRGPVTNAIIQATADETRKAIKKRAEKSYQYIRNGKSLSEIVRELERERILIVEKRTGEIMGEKIGKKVKIKITKIQGGARRPGEIAKRFYVFDADIDVALDINGEIINLVGFAHKVIPNAVLNKDENLLKVIPIVAPAVGELLVSGHTLMNLIVPATAAVAMGRISPEEAAKEALQGAIISGGLPGIEEKIKEAAEITLDYLNKTKGS